MGGVVVLLIVLAVVVVLSIAALLFTPKGPNQVVIRTSIALTLCCCYLMWAVTYMCQLNPLISPERVERV
ncbi:hypothetical protein H8356DRAFT_957158 [Neocallimastix lanati (nom. inval.)]|jgi:V-type H+-transporting ATPase subunit e|nr:hypothetical protein H8356DRAFT_957158 [Neocallimastix sp. JGI-2020a]